MPIYASPSARAFYDSIDNLPDDAIEISDDLYRELMDGQRTQLLDWTVFPPALKSRAVALTADQLVAKIDARVAEIYATWSRFDSEDNLRQIAAQKFQDAGYEGEVSVWISSYARAAGLTDREATDLILQQAEQKVRAQEQLAELRLRKYELSAVAAADRTARYNEIMALIEEIAASVDTQTPVNG